MVQASTKATVECEYEVMCDVVNGVLSNDLECFQGSGTFQRRIFQKLYISETKLL